MSDTNKDGVLQLDKQSDKKQKILKIVGIILSVIEILAAASFIGLMIWINVVPLKYEIATIAVLVVVSALITLAQFHNKVHWVGKAFAVILTVVLIIGDVYIVQAKGTMHSITEANTKTDVVSVYVLKDDPAKTIGDAANYVFGYHEVLDKANTENSIASINNMLGKNIQTKSYTDFSQLAGALYNKEVGAIIINESYVATLEDVYPNFVNDTRVIENESYQSVINSLSDKNTLTDPFTIYLSGNDECGELNQVGRSDVNILIVVNPKTKQIMLINTPRDYYVNVNSLTSGIGKDKLTHAGLFGVDASMSTLSALYNNWDIDYYVRVNFTSVEGIVDALGGITVDSDIAFSTSPDTSDVKFSFVKGENEMTGKQALAYCRERQAVAAGDNQRGQDQMKVISAIINKVASPSILYNYSSVLSSVSSMFQTNLTQDDIASMVKLTMNNSPSWNVQSYAVAGTGELKPSYFFGYSALDVMIPDMKTVNTAVDLMNKTKNGEVFNADDYVKSIN
jgi:LCP family protein required for cell wall assembly